MRLTIILDTANCFFHYTTRDVAFEHILPNGKLKFSTYDQMRDPLENKDWSWSGSWPVDNPDLDAEDPLEDAFFNFQEPARWIRKQAHLLALTVDAPGYSSHANGFAKGWARARMWEQYGENHAGVCLVFDQGLLKANLQTDLEKQLGFGPYHRMVQYDETGSVGTEATKLKPASWPKEINAEFVAQYIEDHHDELFFKKTLDWQTEYEYRFVTTASPEKPLLASYGDALIAVIVGDRFPDWQLPSAEKASGAVEVDLLRMHWHGIAPKPRLLTRKSK